MISKYLLSTCLFIIDDFNEQYRDVATQSDELIEIAYGYTEADLVVRIGYPFRQMAKFVMQTSRDKTDKNDIVVGPKDFRIEVKYLKTQYAVSGNPSNKSQGWKEINTDFAWLMDEIEKGKKNKRAFVVGWFNATGSFANVLPLGVSDSRLEKDGTSRQIDDEKFRYFPFLSYSTVDGKKFTNSITYRYGDAYEPVKVHIPTFSEKLNCLFLGKEDDKFHMAIYY